MQGDIMASMSPESAAGDNKPMCLFEFVTSSSPTTQKGKWRVQMSSKKRVVTKRVKEELSLPIIEDAIEKRQSMTCIKQEREQINLD